MVIATDGAFELPDTTCALPARAFRFSPQAAAAAEGLLAGTPQQLYRALLVGREQEASWLAARQLLAEHFPAAVPSPDPAASPLCTAETITADVAEARAELAAIIERLRGQAPSATADLLRERAPLALLTGCWLDVVSQPVTQPAEVVNLLLAQQVALRGHDQPQRGIAARRRGRLAAAGVYLPDLAAGDFLERCACRALTALHGCVYLALAILPANHLPEIVGVQYAFCALGVDDLVAGDAGFLDAAQLRASLDAFCAHAEEPARARLAAAVAQVITLEREHVALLAALSDWRREVSLDTQLAEIVARHAPYAGPQHGQVAIGSRPLRDWFADPHFDPAEFLAQLRASPVVAADNPRASRLMTATRFGGPMFGIFNEHEAAVLTEWVASAQAQAQAQAQRESDAPPPPIVITVNTLGDARARARLDLARAERPADVEIVAAGEPEPRELLHRLVHIENNANLLALTQRRGREHLDRATVLFEHGSAGRYTDASYFPYSPNALYERGDQIYWDKLVNPYRPLPQIPSRGQVIFLQSTYALASLIDGAWIHRMNAVGHDTRDSDAMVAAIYADEMGHGDLTKNHITLIYRVLASLGFRLPHLRDDAFRDQGDIPDELYPASLFQLCLCLHPDTFYPEILGYNFAIEMFGAGEFRLHEIQKLRHYGFDTCYEQAHLTIDNYSAGHTRQAADIIVSHLDRVQRTVGAAGVEEQWRRVWNGYAGYAYFVEYDLLRRLDVPHDAAPAAGGGGAEAELMI